MGEQGFDVGSHKLVLTDIYGYPKLTPSYTITGSILKNPTSKYVLTNHVEFPNDWDKNQCTEAKQITKPTRMTLRQLQEQRRESVRPHISFDLDGDGQVSQRDLKVAVMFDKDGDGRLNTAEKANCMEALKSGFESQLERRPKHEVILAKALRKSKSETKFMTRTDMLKNRKQNWINYEAEALTKSIGKLGANTAQTSMVSLPKATGVIVDGQPLVSPGHKMGYKSLSRLRSESRLKAREA